MRISTINESKEKLILVDLPYEPKDLAPIMSEKTIQAHYEKLSAGYVDKFNSDEGDLAFNKAGAFLHNIWWTQFQSPKNQNNPKGSSLTFIEKYFGSFYDFKDSIISEALKLQGSGWVYLSKSGNIKMIKNHEIKNDIVLLIDMWEHAYFLDYPADKNTYLKSIWKCINWSNINDRINLRT